MDTVFVALRVLLSLAVVVGLLWVVQRRLTRGRRAPRRSNAMTLVGRQGVGSKASVVLVDVDGKRFMLGVTEHSVNVLHAADVPVEEAVEVPAQADRPDTATRAAAFARAIDDSILSPATWKQTAAAVRQRR